MNFDILNENNFLLYATKCYENPDFAGVSELNKDLKIIVYVNRILKRYVRTGVIKERLVLNHIITLANLFGATSTSRMLFFYCSAETFSTLKTILIFLEYMPENIPEVRNKNLEIDDNMVLILRELVKQ